MEWLDEDEPESNEAGAPGDNQDGSAPGDAGGADSAATTAALLRLEDELTRARKELAEVRKELAGKIVQLSRKDVDKASVQNAVAQEKAVEIAAGATAEKDWQIASLATKATQLEVALAQREEELEETRRLLATQKKALREVVSSAADRGVEERDAAEASRSAQAQAVEEELENLHHDLVATRTRAQLELRAREAELSALRRELEAASRHRATAVAEAESALTDAWQSEVARVQAASQGRITDLEGEVLRLRHAVEDVQRHADDTSLPMELVALNSKKVQVQKEFEVFKEMAMQTARSSREEVARLLEENAKLMARVAAKTMEASNAAQQQHQQQQQQQQGSSEDGYQPPHARGYPQDGGGKGPKVFASKSSDDSYADYLPAVLMRLERQRKGLAPLVVVGSLAALIMVVAVVRAGASAHRQHRGPLCFLAKLGISIGPGCGVTNGLTKNEQVKQGMAELLEVTPRVHDIENVDERFGNDPVAAAGAAGAAHPGGLAAGAAAAAAHLALLSNGSRASQPLFASAAAHKPPGSKPRKLPADDPGGLHSVAPGAALVPAAAAGGTASSASVGSGGGGSGNGVGTQPAATAQTVRVNATAADSATLVKGVPLATAAAAGTAAAPAATQGNATLSAAPAAAATQKPAAATAAAVAVRRRQLLGVGVAASLAEGPEVVVHRRQRRRQRMSQVDELRSRASRRLLRAPA